MELVIYLSYLEVTTFHLPRLCGFVEQERVWNRRCFLGNFNGKGVWFHTGGDVGMQEEMEGILKTCAEEMLHYTGNQTMLWAVG